MSGPARTARGLVFFAAAATEPSRLPTLAEVKDKVHERCRAAEGARPDEDEGGGADGWSRAADFGQAAKAAGLEVKTSELVARGTAWPDVGISPALDSAIFAQPSGGVTAPVTTDNATVIAHVVEKQEAKPEELTKTKDALRQELETDQRSKFFGAYMAKARDRMKINVNAGSCSGHYHRLARGAEAPPPPIEACGSRTSALPCSFRRNSAGISASASFGRNSRNGASAMPSARRSSAGSTSASSLPSRS